MSDYSQKSLELHKKLRGKIGTYLKAEINTKDDLSTVYSPGVAEPCLQIAKNKDSVYDYTMKGNTVAVISDGSAVLGLGNIGPEAALPVMEGKCALFKNFAGLNAFPIVLDTQDTEEIIKTIKNIAPVFGGINLEDISAPRCFEIEERLKAELDIPVFHDDQHGTAIVCLAGLINALEIVGKKKEDIKVVINGVGAAGVAITKLLLKYGVKNIVVVDSSGTIYKGREGLNPVKEMLTDLTNTMCILNPDGEGCIKGGLESAVIGTDVFIGVSVPGVLTKEMVQTMNSDAIIFAMANPIPEIMPEDAYEAGAKIVATGRSDYPNQINNVLVFPGIFKGALEKRVNNITDEMKISAAKALASAVENPSPEKIIPGPFEKGIADLIAASIK
ncbi:NADP-dependent malic enzyme [Candidatus Gracilibacteria bacterium]|nr:NADP-dependent malic enzyme [Candidatus Gracilibacteria bacterium]